MKTMKKLAGSLLSINFLLFAVLTTISCEIGLGASVDTETPDLSIDSSIVDAVISGDFNIEGTYSDDGTIADLHAILKRTDGNGSDIRISGTMEENSKKRGSGIWKIPVKSKSEKITDGSYQATVYIKDGVGRVTTQSTTFTIDNTPPVLILSKPNSNPGDETVSTYGQRVFLEGSIADTAKETYIEVEFYDNANLSGQPLATIKTDAIAPTDVNSNNAKLTIYKEEVYDKIYRASGPGVKEGSKDVYIKLTASDVAGNTTADFYFSKDLAKNITKSSGENAFGLAPIDIYSILNGTDALKNKTRTSGDVAKIKELLGQNAKRAAMFSLNPENSPYFTVSGMKTLTKAATQFDSADNGYWVINGAQTLEISVFMGSDSIELVDDENFYVYLLECDAKGEPLNNASPIKLYSKSRETGSGIEKKTYYSIGGKQTHKTTSGAYVFTVPMSKTLKVDPDKDGQAGFVTQALEYGKNYVIFVSGKDNEDNPIEPNETGYGFHFTSSNGAPALEITEPADNTVFHKKGDGVLFEGSVKSEEGVPQVTVWNGSTKLADIPLDTEIEGEWNNFSYTIPASKFNQGKSEIYSLTLKATRSDTKTEKAYSVWYDVEGPSIEIQPTAIKPVVTANGKNNNINGILSISGTIIDAFDKFGSATYRVMQNGAVVSGIGGSIESSFDIQLDTTRLEDKKNADIIIEAYDRVGNKSEWKKTYYVDQETDRPIITNTESGKDITKGTGAEGLAFVENGNNLYVRGGNLVLSVSDDDGVTSASVTIQEYNKATGEYSPAEDKQNITYDSPAVISHTLPNSVGIYRATVTVYDKNYNTLNPALTPNNSKQIQFFLRVTGTGPDVSITPNKEYIKTGGSYVLKFNVTDEGNKPYMLKLGSNTNPETNYASINVDEFEYTISPVSTDILKFTIIDKNSSFTEKTFTPRFDDIAPTVTITNWPDNTSLTEDETYLFKGTMSDAGKSGIEKVQIKFVDGEHTTTDNTGWADCTAGSINWNSEITWASNAVFATEGKKTVFVKAIDGAGNETTDYKIFTYDKSKPVLTIPDYLSNTVTNVIYSEVDSNGYSLSGTVTDTNGLATTDAIVIKVDNVTVKTMAATEVTGQNWTYSIPTGTDAGKLKANQNVLIQVTAKDIAGKTDTKQFYVYYDTASPALEVSSPVTDESVADPQKAIKGTVSDEGYGIQKIEFELRKQGTTTVVTSLEGGVDKPVTSEYYPIVIKGEQWFYAGPAGTAVNPVVIPLGSVEGALDLYVKAVEKKNTAGNSGGRETEKTISFYYDKANPGLTEEGVSTTGKTTNAAFTLTGKVWDSNNLASLTIQCGNKTWVSGTASNITFTGSTKLENAPASNNWTATFVVGSGNSSSENYIADGTKEFIITARDIAGKEKQLSRSVVVDTTAPSITAPVIDSTVTDGTVGGWYKTRSLPIEVTASDTNGSGIAKVEYSTSADGGSTWSNWNPLSFSNNKYQGTVSFAADGKNLKFKVHATDVAGNESADKPEVTVNIDTSAPTLTVTQNENLYVQSGSSITVSGSYADPQSGVKALVAKIGEEEFSSSVTYKDESGTFKAYSSVTSKDTITDWKLVFAPTVSGKFSVQGENRAGDKTSEIKAFDITIDNQAPVISNVKLEEVKGSGAGATTRDAYYNSADSKYYVNNQDKTFKISGVSTDDIGIESVVLTVTNTTATPATELTPAIDGTTGKWSFTFDMSTWTTGATAVVTVTDKSGRETTETLNIKFDVTAPVTVHKIDDSLKNLEFRIGDYKNDAGEAGSTDPKDLDVGGKYSNGTYGSALTMQIRGYFPDETNGSGINKYYYKTFNNEEVKISSTIATGTEPVEGTGANAGMLFFKDDEALINYVIANKTDVFTPLAEVETKRVEYNIIPGGSPATAQNTNGRFGGSPVNGYTVNSKGYVQFRTEVATNFKTTIKGFVEGKNYLVIVAEDNAGNIALDTAIVEGVEYPCYSLNVDITAPTIPQKHEGDVYANVVASDTTTQKVEISGTVSDKPNVANGSSGLKSIVFTSDQSSESVTIKTFTDATSVEQAAAGDTTLKHWTVDVRPLLSTDGNAIISAKVTDNAGFSTSVPVANITVDKTAPKIRINSPAANAKTGSTITISGTADDGNGAGIDATKPMVLYYTRASALGGVTTAPETITTGTDASTSWVECTAVPALSGSDWTCSSVDVSGFTTNNANTDIYFTVSAVDESGTGNTGYAVPRKITVDRKKPAFSSGNVGGKASGSWFNSTTLNISGIFTDDGSGVTTIKYQLGSGAEESLSTTDGTYNTNVSGFAAGQNTLKVWAVDAVGNESDKQEFIARIDTVAPELTETGIGTTGKTTNTTFTLTGKAWDTNQLDRIEVKCGTTTWTSGSSSNVSLTKATSQPASTNWSATFVTGTANNSAANYIADGTTEFTIIAYDIAGQTKQLSRTVVVDTQKPVIGTVTVDSTGGVTIGGSIWYQTTSIPVTVPVTDSGFSAGISKVEYSTQSGNSATWAPLSYNGTNYNGTINFTGEGTQTLRLKATDVAGNISTEETVSVNIDISAPELAALYYKKGTETAKALDSAVYLKTGTQITVYGNYKDEQSGVENLTFKIGNTAVTPAVTYSTTAIGNSAPADSLYTIASDSITGEETTIKSWKAVITPAADGQFTVTGKNRVQAAVEDQKIFTIAVDGTAPTVTIINPAEGTTGANALNGTSYSFRINADDGEGVGVTKLSYAFATTSAVPAASAWTTIDFTGGDKNIDMPLVTGTTPVTTNGKITSICEGNWYVFAKATDKAGNETATAVSRAFAVDRSNPTLTVSGLNESGVNALYKEIASNIYVLSGTVSDTNALASTGAVSIEIDEQTTVSADIDGTNWSYNLNVGTTAGTLKKDELVSVKVTATDITGKTAVKNYTLYYDTKDPELEITAPVTDESVETNEKVIKGTVSDGGYGIKKLEYSLYSGATLIASGDTDHPNADYPIAIKGEQWYISKNEGKVPLGATEGSLSLVVTATENKPDGAPTVTGIREYVTTKTVNFYYDTANPTLTETEVGATGKTKNTGFTLSGLATDSNALASIEISWGTNNKITLTPTSEQLKSMNWSQEFVVGSATGTNHVANGTNEFTIIAKDITGKEKQLTRTVVVDTVAPTCGASSITSTGNLVSGKTWYKSSFIDITLGNVQDAGGTGISKVEYTTESGDSAHWYSMSGSGTTYTATVNCANQGVNTIRVKVTDVAGNETAAGTLTAYVDTKEPSLENSWAKYLTGNYEAVSELLINGDNGYELKISAKDEDGGTGANAGNNSGIASVQYSYGSYTIDGTKSGDDWIITVPKTGNGTNNYSSTGSNKIYIIIKDNAGNEIKERILTVTKDTTDPTVEIKSFTRAGSQTNSVDDVNGTITISGLADDTNRFGSVKLEYQKDGTSTWTLIPTTSQTSWSTTLDTTTLDDNSKYTIKATATDAAGNTAEDTQDIYVNQDTDRPVITVTNMTLATAANETSYLKRTSRLEGTVSDDDGNVTKLEYSINGTSWTEATLEYGTAWSIADLPEGDNKLYFRVTDSVNATPFTTAAEVTGATTEAANQPKIKDNSNTYVTHTQGSLALNFKVVTKQPDVEEKQYQVYNSSTDTWETRENLGTLGGVYTKFKISLKAKSDAFIGSVQAKYTTDSYDIDFTCDDANHSNNAYHTWRTGAIDLADGKTEVKLKVSDASSATDPMTLEQTITYSVDNTAPAINIKDPSSTVGVKETMQFDLTEAATTYFAVTKNDVTTAPAADSSAWTEILDTSNGLTRYVFFDDDLNETDHTERFALYLTETSTNPKYLGITTLAAIERTENPFEEITTVKFWVKAVDDCGNTGYANKEVNVDPQGNRPTVTLGYPVNVLKDGNYVAPTLGGTIRLDGNVTDDVAPKYVWVKIEREGAAFSATDLKFLSEKGYTIGKMTTNAEVSAGDVTALANNADVSDYAIRVEVTGTSWNLSINGNQEFNVANAEAHLKFKIYATDADPDKVDASLPPHIHRSAEITQQIVIDSRTPYINTSELYLVKFNGNTEVARKEYKEGEDVDGIWYLQGKIKDDDSGIRTVSYKKNGAATYTEVITAYGGNVESIGGDTHFYFKKVAHSNNASMYDYEFSVPLGSSTANQVGTDSIQIYAVENTSQNLHTEPIFKVTYDNKAPVFNTDSNNAFVKLSNSLYNSSGFYTFGAIASEDAVTIGEEKIKQSGVERIAFYFTRDLSYSLSALPDGSAYSEHINEKDSKTNDLFDVMIYHSNGDAADVTSGNMIVNYKGKTDNSELTYSEGLYWRSHSGTASGKAFTYTGTADPNIHAGGLVKINGVIYKIESVSGNTIILPSNIGSATTAAFALCNVIDNSGEKNGSSTSSEHGYGFGYYGSRVTDDGDLITETFNSQGTDWIFDASINSRNLPDGPITLHMVAFDKAGNVTTPYTMTGTVKNNAPRLAGLVIGTDENGNGQVDTGELVSAYSDKFKKGYDTAGNEMREVTFPVIPDGGDQTSLLTVKGVTVVKPEIIGGNGAISYTYQVDSGAVVSGGDLAKNGGGTVSGTTDEVVTGYITLPVSAFIGTTGGADAALIPDGTKSEFKFTFGDSTPGTSQDDTTGKNSATMNVFLDVALRETNKAKNWILPFYWKSATDNSLFGQSKDNGHIELAKDWVTTASYTGDSGEYDADPKVSGKIKLEGIARDDTLLNEIKVKFGKSMGGLGTSDTTIATYNAAAGSWTTTALENDGSINTTSGWASEVQQATYQDLKDVGIITAIPDDKEPASKVPYTSQDYGHVVHWILYLNTEKVDGVAATDVTVTATATDRGKPKWNATNNAPDYTSNEIAVTGGTAISGAVTKNGSDVSVAGLTGNYRVDVVPYITDVKRNGDYNTHRSGMGNYPLMREETGNTVTGFNLGVTDSETPANTTARLYISSAPNVVTGLSVESLTVSASGNTATFTIPATAVDGYLQYAVHISDTVEIPALNNMNNNAVYTKEEGDTRWYDDRFVRIWQSNASDKFAASYPTYPAMAMGSNGDLFMSYTFYSKSVVYYNQLMSNDKTQIFTAGDQPEETDIMVNGESEVNVIYQANHHYGGDQNRWCARASGAGSINLYNPSAPDVTTYAKGRYWRFEGCWHNQMLQQLKNAKVATSGNNVYHTIWYDKITKAIKYSNVNKSATQNAYIPNDTGNNEANITHPGEIGWVVLDGDADLDDIVQTNQRTTDGYNGGEAKYPNNTFNNSYLNGIGNTSMYSIALSKTPAQRTAIMNLSENSLRKDSAISANGNYTRYDYTGAGTGTAGYNANCYENVSTTSTCGEYAAICVTSAGYPVVVYYDVDHKMLKVARGMNTNPKGMNTANTNDGASAWRIQKVALTDGHLGNDASYVSAAIDSDGYLHIAFQNSRGELIYTRSTNTASELSLTQGFTFNGSVIVDTNGTWASITVDSNNVPQIAYMANTSGYDTLKLAYPVESATALWTAATTWETMYAPMNAKSSNVKTCVVARPSNATGGQPTTQTDSYWKTGIGFATSEDYRVMKYIGNGLKAY